MKNPYFLNLTVILVIINILKIKFKFIIKIFKNKAKLSYNMTIKIFNTLSGKSEEFKPLKKGKVSIYLCGPTVYDIGHLGHGRSAVAFDIVRRYFLYKGYDVVFASNYTDIDDKMIKRANEEGISVKQLADKIIPEYEKDYAALGIMKPDIMPKATDHINEIIELIKKLEEKEFAYVLDDGVYFDVYKFEEYGKLSHRKLEDMKAGARVKVDEKKKHHQDFVLWKFKKENEPSWKSPWGEGRPGWHIECSAMTMKHLGETFDIHAGGQDLIFPHHEDEIAQSECATGKPFANYWMHNGFVKIDEEKMSKSLGNFFTIKDILKKFDAKVVRYFLLSTHYRSPINFADKLLEQSKQGLERLQEFTDNLECYKSEAGNNKNVKKLIEKTKKGFETGMDNDFEISTSLGIIFEFVKDMNKLMAEKNISVKNAEKARAFMFELDTVLNVLEDKDDKLPEEIQALVDDREKAREHKEWARSDELRDELQKKGYIVKDTKDGQVVKKA